MSSYNTADPLLDGDDEFSQYIYDSPKMPHVQPVPITPSSKSITAPAQRYEYDEDTFGFSVSPTKTQRTANGSPSSCSMVASSSAGSLSSASPTTPARFMTSDYTHSQSPGKANISECQPPHVQQTQDSAPGFAMPPTPTMQLPAYYNFSSMPSTFPYNMVRSYSSPAVFCSPPPAGPVRGAPSPRATAIGSPAPIAAVATLTGSHHSQLRELAGDVFLSPKVPSTPSRSRKLPKEGSPITFATPASAKRGRCSSDPQEEDESDNLRPSPSKKQRSPAKRASGRDGDEVWPEDVEAAFAEALRLIPKLGRRKVLINGKACGRNELISDFIYRKTGKSRSRKQVSSHIQVIKNIKRPSEDDEEEVGEDYEEPDLDTFQQLLIQAGFHNATLPCVKTELANPFTTKFSNFGIESFNLPPMPHPTMFASSAITGHTIAEPSAGFSSIRQNKRLVVNVGGSGEAPGLAASALPMHNLRIDIPSGDPSKKDLLSPYTPSFLTRESDYVHSPLPSAGLMPPPPPYASAVLHQPRQVFAHSQDSSNQYLQTPQLISNIDTQAVAAHSPASSSLTHQMQQARFTFSSSECLELGYEFNAPKDLSKNMPVSPSTAEAAAALVVVGATCNPQEFFAQRRASC